MTEQATIQSLVEVRADREWPVGEVRYEVCQTCGYLIWACTKKDAPRKVVVGHLFHPCPRCQDAARRNPEVVAWVMSVLSFQEMKRNEQLSTRQ